MAIGYIYVLSNEHMPGLVKVGFTCDTVELRARQIFTTGVPSPFLVEYFKLTDDVEIIERSAHAALANRVSPNREFFKASIDEVVSVIDKLVKDPEQSFRRAPSNRILIECKRCGHKFDPRPEYPHCPKCFP